MDQSLPTIPPPHPDPHRPVRFLPPPLACDAHCHVFGPADRFPYAPDRAYTPPDSGIDKFEILQDRLGLSRAVFVQASCHGTDNSAMVDAICRGKGRYGGVAMIDDSFTEAQIGELHDVGVRGTRFNFVAHLGGAPDLDLVFGIGAHRSIFSHSILMGSALETAFLSLLRLVRLTHKNLEVAPRI